MRISVIGSGYVGLVAACCLANSKHEVIAVEKNPVRLDMLREGSLPIHEKGLDKIFHDVYEKGTLTFARDVEDIINEVDLVIIAVGTPSLPDGRVDLSQVYEVAATLTRNVTKSLTVVMKSTVPPGTGKTLQERFFSKASATIRYVSNPEFLREGNAVYDWYNPDRIVVGSNDSLAARKVLDLYQDIDAPKVIMGLTSAEMTKYAANAFLATKISFINEIANLCELVGADILEVAPAVGMDKRIGQHFLSAGLGYGGSCFPKDTKGLDHLSSLNGYSFSLLKAIIEVNARQRLWAVRKLARNLGGLADQRICVYGLAFKPQTDDIRESPACDIIDHLVREGASVSATDPLALDNAKRVLPGVVYLDRDPYEVARDCNAILLATEWDEFVNLDWKQIKTLMKPPFVVLDGRNALDSDHLIALGFRYVGVGRCF